MIVVGYLYNNNGMASWCIEASKALHHAGLHPILVHSSKVVPDENWPFEKMVFDFPDAQSSNSMRLKSAMVVSMLSAKSSGFSYYVYLELVRSGRPPKAFLLNQSNMLDARVPVPQFLCAWVFPTGFSTYLRGAVLATEKRGFKEALITVLSSIGFYFKDMAAYRRATVVLANSPEMFRQLVRKGIRSELIPPCYSVETINQRRSTTGKIVVLMSALDLESRRKKIPWALESINSLPVMNVKITLVGKPGNTVNKLTAASRHDFDLRGLVPRSKALQLYSETDIFLFTSTVDDWGYVLIEAMMHGVAILVPDKTPYNYIAGNPRLTFKAGDRNDFIRKFKALIESPDLNIVREECRRRAEELFSGEVFASRFDRLLNGLSNT